MHCMFATNSLSAKLTFENFSQAQSDRKRNGSGVIRLSLGSASPGNKSLDVSQSHWVWCVQFSACITITARTHARAHTHTHTDTHKHINTHAHTHTHRLTHTCTRTQIVTHVAVVVVVAEVTESSSACTCRAWDPHSCIPKIRQDWPCDRPICINVYIYQYVDICIEHSNALSRLSMCTYKRTHTHVSTHEHRHITNATNPTKTTSNILFNKTCMIRYAGVTFYFP